MRRTGLVVCALVVLALWAVTLGLADGGIGGMFVDVPTSHPAFSAVRDLVQRGVIVIGAGGEFSGNAPLLRYDAAQWISRAVKNAEGTRPAVDLTPRVTTLETRMTALDGTMTREMQAMRAEIARLSQGPGLASIAAAEQRAQTAFVLGVTGVVLALAAVALALWF